MNEVILNEGIYLCSRLRESLEESSYIPEHRLNGEIRPALIYAREEQLRMLTDIEQNIQKLLRR